MTERPESVPSDAIVVHSQDFGLVVQTINRLLNPHHLRVHFRPFNDWTERTYVWLDKEKDSA